MDYKDFLEEWRDGNTYISAYSSGSTGEPKEIKLNKDFVSQSALRTNRYFGIDNASRLHSCVSPDFIGGKMMAVRSELSGATLTYETPSNQPLSSSLSKTVKEGRVQDYRIVKKHPITLLAVVPSQMLYILEHLDEMPKIDNIIIGGSPVNPALRLQIIESGLNAFETYGMTETASHIALRKIAEGEDYFETLDDITVTTDYRDCLVITIPVSKDFTISDNNCHSTEQQYGEKATSCETTPRIIGQNGLQETVITTNDIAEVISKRKFRILGRYDNMIITGGKKVNPIDTERLIEEAAMADTDLKHAIGTSFLITGTPDLKWGQAVTLRIESSDNSSRLSDEQIILKLKKILPHYAVPKRIERVEHLERTPNGKLKRTH